MRSNHKARMDRLIARHPDAVCIDGAMHRRDQVLVPAEQADAAGEAGASFVERVETFTDIGVHRLRLRANAKVNVPEFAAQLRDRHNLSASANHILRGEPDYVGGPFGVPTLSAPVPAPVPTGESRTVTVAVLDTGITPHPWFTDTVWWDQVTPEQLDPISANCDYELESQSGHGTFVAGVVLQKAPDARLWIERVLDDIGICDELGLLQSLGRIRRREETTGVRLDVVNLSLGGYAHHDHPSELISAALRKFASHTVVVTAAGNNGSERAFWPAALKDCIAVGARAPFSDRGWWVDAHAPGVDVAGPFPVRGATGDIEPSYATWSGTSFAAPYVAGAIAKLAGSKDITAREAVEMLLGGEADPELGVEIG
ncbi:S8 family peptidase [Actinospica robiniae]|uniref:S8 family peptidase n=1 Tax=Actinospica robiniae TaxID=304901 RepID=UPI00040089EC|nr:S8 family serine peptidase [Actinospica robiniae]